MTAGGEACVFRGAPLGSYSHERLPKSRSRGDVASALPAVPANREDISPVKTIDISASEHRLADNRLCGDRLLKRDCALQLVLGVECVDYAKHRLDGGDVGFTFLNGI